MAKEMFNDADTDNSGAVDMDELVAAIRQHMDLEDGPTPKQVAKWIMERFDRNGDGKIQKKEFRKTVKEIAKEHNHELTKEDWEKAMELFNDADANGNGEVDFQELRKSVKKHMKLAEDDGAPSAKDIAEEIMKHFDKNGDGKISKKEFRQTIR